MSLNSTFTTLLESFLLFSGGYIPIVPLFAETPRGDTVFISPNNAMEAMSISLQPLKVMYLNVDGPFLMKNGQVSNYCLYIYK